MLVGLRAPETVRIAIVRICDSCFVYFISGDIFLSFSSLLIISAFNVLLLHCILYRNNYIYIYIYSFYTIIYLLMLCYFCILINTPFLF